jgi:hypothetical protein
MRVQAALETHNKREADASAVAAQAQGPGSYFFVLPCAPVPGSLVWGQGRRAKSDNQSLRSFVPNTALNARIIQFIV